MPKECSMRKPINVADYRTLAKKRLPRMVFDYLEGGAEDELGLLHNRRAFEKIRFTSHRLTDVSKRHIDTELFDRPQKAPVIIAPTGLNGLLWPNGDLVLARAAAKFGIPFVLSTASTASIETVARAADGDHWFQLYVVHRRLAELLVKRALRCGYSTLVLTTDVGVNGKRERDSRNGFSLPIKYNLRTIMDGVLHPRWSLDLLHHGVPQLANFASSEFQDSDLQAALLSRQMDASFSFDDLKWLRDLWPHTLLIKGLSLPEDAARCMMLGADGVILSNHGGRQLDSAVSPMETLASTAARISGPVLVDSGVRRGSDVIKALALGAKAVLLGRATLYGLAANGQDGVEGVLDIFMDEIDRTLAQIGCPSVSHLSGDFIFDANARKVASKKLLQI